MYTFVTFALICAGLAALAVKMYRNEQIVSPVTVIRQCRQCGWCQATAGLGHQQIFAADVEITTCQTAGHNFEFVHLPAKTSCLQKLIGVSR